jgi:hypothetical protein
MDYRQLGDSDLKVSALGLGTMTFGEQNTRDEAFAQLDAALEAGVNFIDTAEIYPVPPRAETYGATEEIIGRWLADRGTRDRVVLATKVAGRADWLPHIRGGPKLTMAQMAAALDGSETPMPARAFSATPASSRTASTACIRRGLWAPLTSRARAARRPPAPRTATPPRGVLVSIASTGPIGSDPCSRAGTLIGPGPR